jgi:hypothetical protein
MAIEREHEGALVEMSVRSDGINVLAKAYDANGREITLPSRIVFLPQFFSPYEQVRLGTLEVIAADGDERQSVARVAIDISGRNGALKMPRVEAKSTVKPYFMAEERIEQVQPGDAPKPNVVEAGS